MSQKLTLESTPAAGDSCRVWGRWWHWVGSWGRASWSCCRRRLPGGRGWLGTPSWLQSVQGQCEELDPPTKLCIIPGEFHFRTALRCSCNGTWQCCWWLWRRHWRRHWCPPHLALQDQEGRRFLPPEPGERKIVEIFWRFYKTCESGKERPLPPPLLSFLTSLSSLQIKGWTTRATWKASSFYKGESGLEHTCQGSRELCPVSSFLGGSIVHYSPLKTKN